MSYACQTKTGHLLHATKDERTTLCGRPVAVVRKEMGEVQCWRCQQQMRAGYSFAIRRSC